MYRETWFEIDLDAIQNNVLTIKNINHKKFIAVLKANAYGCGAKQVAKAVLDAGADMIAVSSVDEALALRNFGIDSEILVLGHTDPHNVKVLIENNISATAYSLSWANSVIQEDCVGLKVHLKVETGMNRIGFRNLEELKNGYDLLQEHGCLMKGIFTHFACAENDIEMTQRQFDRFKEAYDYLGHDFEWIHCDNSVASISFKDELSNACRVGISLYGISDAIKLKPALSLYTKLFYVKTVPTNETIGYGATYTTSTDSLIGTMPIGYADGFIRANQGRKVYIDGSYCEVVGRVCMDQTMVLLPELKKEGSIVEIFGPHISLESMANELHTIPYEIICLLTSRVTRVYTSQGKVIDEDNEYLDLSASSCHRD